MVAPNKRKRQLATAVARAFNRLGISAQELLTGQIVHTDLPWRCPPLECDAELDGAPFSSFIDYEIKVDPAKLIAFWQSGLEQLWSHPTHAIGPSGWRGVAAALPGTTDGERALRFCVPEGFPDALDEFSGVLFSMEVAKVFMQAVPGVTEWKRDEDNYFAVYQGQRIGVVDGLPTWLSSWESNASGMVEMLATGGRGRTTTTCRYDLLSKVRSVLYERSSQFKEFDGLDWALQTLAIQYQDRLCTELQRAVENMPTDMFVARKKVKALEEAIALMEGWSINDRVKILSLFDTLVPEVLTASAFQRHIFNTYTTIPALLSAPTERKIFTFLRNRKAHFEKELGK